MVPTEPRYVASISWRNWDAWARWGRRHAAVLMIFGLTGIVAILAAIYSPTFRTFSNITDVLRQSIVLGLVTIGQLFVMLAGGIDMSVGMIARVVGLATAVVLTWDVLPPYLVILFGLAGGCTIGLINGAMVARLNAQPFILTLGMMGILYGVGLAITDGPTGLIPISLLKLYDLRLWGVPVAVFAMALIWLVAWWVLARTRFGRSVYVVGGSPNVARLSGLDGDRTILLCYMVSGLMAAAAGIFLLTRSGVGNPNMAIGLEFRSIVAAAIGGVSLYGGRGSLLGVLGAVLLISIISNVFDLFQISPYYRDLALGLIVVLAVAVKRSEKNT